MDKVIEVDTYKEAFEIIDEIILEEDIKKFAPEPRPVFIMLEDLFDNTPKERRPRRFKQFLEYFLSKKVGKRLMKSDTPPTVNLIWENIQKLIFSLIVLEYQS